MKTGQQTCPCGSGLAYTRCCEPCLCGEAIATSAEQLMRSRYTAYVMHHAAYLLNSWHPSTRPQHLELEQDPPTNWLGLKIISTESGNAGDTEGWVEFVARYKIHGKAHRLHEKSRFIHEEGRWYYLDGTHP